MLLLSAQELLLSAQMLIASVQMRLLSAPQGGVHLSVHLRYKLFKEERVSH